jgi:hypothetical protein
LREPARPIQTNKERDPEIIEVPAAEKDRAEPTTDDRVFVGRRGPAATYWGLK